MTKPNHQRLAVLLLCLSAIPVLTSCEKLLRKEKSSSPAASPDAALGLRLANGMKVVLDRRPGLPQVQITTWYRVGAKNEDPVRTGLASLTARLMYGQSRNTPEGYTTLASRAGAGPDDMTLSVDSDRTMFQLNLPADSLEYGLWLESDRMGFAFDKITAEDLLPAKRQLSEEARSRLAQPWGGQAEILAETMYPPGHPYAWPPQGKLGDMQNLRPEDVRFFHQTWFAPNNATLVISGDFDIESAKQMVGKYFAPLSPGPSPVRITTSVPRLEQMKTVVKEERGNSAKFTFAWHTPASHTKDEAALDLAAQILGWGPGARLVQRLVTTEQIAVRVAASHQTREASGLMLIEVVPTPKGTPERISAAIEAELERLARSGPSKSELRAAKNQMRMLLSSSTERASGRTERLAKFTALFDDPAAASLDEKRWDDLTSDDVEEATEKWLAGEPRLELRYVTDPSGRPDTADSDRTQAPPVTLKMPKVTLNIERKTTKSGLEVVLVQSAKQPRVDAALLIKADASSEKDAGTAWLGAASLAQATQQKRDTMEQLHEQGSLWSIEGDKYGTTVLLASLRENFRSSALSLTKALSEPAWNPETFDQLRKLRQTQITSEAGNIASVAASLIPRLLFDENHPAAKAAAGTAKSIESVNFESVQQWHKTWWTPTQATLVVVGDVSLDEVADIGEEIGQRLQKTSVAESVAPAGKPTGASGIHVLDAKGSDAVEIRFSGPLPGRVAPDLAAQQTALTMLGGAEHFGRHLAARKISANVGSGQTLRKDFGWWTLAVSTTQADVAGVFGAFRDAMASVRTAVAPAELDRIRLASARQHLMSLETPLSTLRLLVPWIGADLPLTPVTSWLDSLAAETPESVMGAASRSIDQTQTIALVIGDSSKLTPTLGNLEGWGPVKTIDLGNF